MPINIRLLQTLDPALPKLALLMEEMQSHYEVPCPPRADIISGLERRPVGAELLVAEEHGVTLGFCAFGAIYPGPGLKAGIFLKELYVSKSCRGQGLGHSLMRALAILTRDRGLSRLDWTADANNERLLTFYDEIGAARKTDKLFYRLDGEALVALGTSNTRCSVEKL